MKIKNQIIKLMLGAIIAFTNFSCTEGDNDKTIDKLPTIVEIAKADPQFSVLAKALQVYGLENTLSGQGSYTVFAPTDTAFAAQGITMATLNATAALNLPQTDPSLTAIRRILQNHVLGVGTRSSDLLFTGYSKTFAAGPAGLPSNAANTNLSIFVNLIGTDVLVNGGVANGGAKVIKADIDASNGIIHVVDGVILLPTLVNHVIANPAFSTLLSIVTSTGGTFGNQAPVLAVLTGATAALPKTVFAPLNSAFATATTTGFLTVPYIATAGNVTKVLQYHVTAANVNTSTSAFSSTSWASSLQTIITVAPVSQSFTIAPNTLKITSAFTGSLVSNIKVVNVQAVNGVIHAVDTVLQPN